MYVYKYKQVSDLFAPHQVPNTHVHCCRSPSLMPSEYIRRQSVWNIGGTHAICGLYIGMIGRV